MRNIIVHINGWPGTGKLTIARLMAHRLQARLIDNHTLLNPAEAVFPRDDPRFAALRAAVRQQVFDAMAVADPDQSFLFTDALADGFAEDRAWFADVERLAGSRSARLVSVVLEIDQAENLRRVGSPGRDENRKMTAAEALLEVREKYTLLRPVGMQHVTLDVTHLTAMAAADALISELARG